MPITKKDISNMISDMMLSLQAATSENKLRLRHEIAILRNALKKGKSSEEWGHAEHLFAMWSEG